MKLASEVELNEPKHRSSSQRCVQPPLKGTVATTHGDLHHRHITLGKI